MVPASRADSRQAVNGVLLLNKPSGLTSNAALQRVKRLLRARKAGHTGSLDPAATGMLPLCFGEATKISTYLLDADKCYRVVARLGEATDTGDADGRVTERAEVPALGFGEWQELLAGFVGRIEQVPPMYSALKQDGKRLYELARKGEVVERAPRTVVVRDLALAEARNSRLVFRVRCSKGTYVRTLVEDIARTAGTVAHTAALHRESVGDFRPRDMLDLVDVARLAAEGPEVLQSRLVPADRALSGLAATEVTAPEADRFLNGQRLEGEPAGAGLVRVYGPRARFLGIAERDATGRLSPRRVFSLPE